MHIRERMYINRHAWHQSLKESFNMFTKAHADRKTRTHADIRASAHTHFFRLQLAAHLFEVLWVSENFTKSDESAAK